MNEQFIHGLMVFLFILWCIPSEIWWSRIFVWYLIPKNKFLDIKLELSIQDGFIPRSGEIKIYRWDWLSLSYKSSS